MVSTRVALISLFSSLILSSSGTINSFIADLIASFISISTLLVFLDLYLIIFPMFQEKLKEDFLSFHWRYGRKF